LSGHGCPDISKVRQSENRLPSEAFPRRGNANGDARTRQDSRVRLERENGGGIAQLPTKKAVDLSTAFLVTQMHLSNDT